MQKIASAYLKSKGIEGALLPYAENRFIDGYVVAQEHAHVALEEAEAEIDRLQTKISDAGILTTEHILDMSKIVDVSSSETLNNSSKNSNGWISVKDRLPGPKDGVTQLWMKGCSFADLVLGCHAVMTDKGETIEGVLDMNKPDGIWDLSDFSHWMPLPKPPEE